MSNTASSCSITQLQYYTDEFLLGQLKTAVASSAYYNVEYLIGKSHDSLDSQIVGLIRTAPKKEITHISKDLKERFEEKGTADAIEECKFTIGLNLDNKKSPHLYWIHNDSDADSPRTEFSDLFMITVFCLNC